MYRCLLFHLTFFFYYSDLFDIESVAIFSTQFKDEWIVSLIFALMYLIDAIFERIIRIFKSDSHVRDGKDIRLLLSQRLYSSQADNVFIELRAVLLILMGFSTDYIKLLPTETRRYTLHETLRINVNNQKINNLHKNLKFPSTKINNLAIEYSMLPQSFKNIESDAKSCGQHSTNYSSIQDETISSLCVSLLQKFDLLMTFASSTKAPHTKTAALDTLESMHTLTLVNMAK